MARPVPRLPREELAALAFGCACRTTRATSRAVTRRYDEALRPTGLRATQVSLLVAATLHGSATISQLAETLAMDRTTLTRELRPLEQQELMVLRPGEDRRARHVEVTDQGRRAIAEAMPLWRDIQNRVVAELGPDRWNALAGSLGDLAAAAERA